VRDVDPKRYNGNRVPKSQLSNLLGLLLRGGDYGFGGLEISSLIEPPREPLLPTSVI
jgi:hypothetical protein